MKRNTDEKMDCGKLARVVLVFALKYILNPILVGLILYGGDIIGGEQGIRVAIAISIINTSYLFLGSISRFPSIGRYTNMLAKVYILIDYTLSYIPIIVYQ